MFPPVITQLRRTGLQPSEIFLVLERYMKCGTRHCGHCYINNRYVCDDGPVFQLAELLPLRDALPELGKHTGAMVC
jgi:anaerobic sulfite reductase subunit B